MYAGSNTGEVKPHVVSFPIALGPKEKRWLQSRVLGTSIELQHKAKPYATADYLRAIHAPHRARFMSNQGMRSVDLNLVTRRSVVGISTLGKIVGLQATLFPEHQAGESVRVGAKDLDAATLAKEVILEPVTKSPRLTKSLGYDELTHMLSKLVHKPNLAKLGHPRSQVTIGNANERLGSRLANNAEFIRHQELYGGGQLNMQLLSTEAACAYFNESAAKLKITDLPTEKRTGIEMTALSTVDLPQGQLHQQFRYDFEVNSPAEPPAHLDLISYDVPVDVLTDIGTRTQVDIYAIANTAISTLMQSQL